MGRAGGEGAGGRLSLIRGTLVPAEESARTTGPRAPAGNSPAMVPAWSIYVLVVCKSWHPVLQSWALEGNPQKAPVQHPMWPLEWPRVNQ